MTLNSDAREDQCLIWRGYPAKVYRELVQDSPRAGGSYALDSETYDWLWWRRGNLEERQRSKITTWLVDQRRLGNTSPTITRAVIDATETARPLSVHERADRLLRFLADETTTIGQAVTLGEPATEEEPSPFRIYSSYSPAWSDVMALYGPQRVSGSAGNKFPIGLFETNGMDRRGHSSPTWSR